MSTSKSYAVVARGGLVLGSVSGIFPKTRLACAGAVTVDGSPVNKFGVSLSLDQRHMQQAIEGDLPAFRVLESHGQVFITSWFEPGRGGHNPAAE